MARLGRRITVTGTVQGVGFRPFVYRLAHELGLAGWVRNDAAGVTVEAFGPADALDALERRLSSGAPPAARVTTLHASPLSDEPLRTTFEIVESGGATEKRAAIPPDLATCPDCLRELHDAADRRHRYPFTNCTSCGPRFTIALGIPYDRPATTMAGFRMCPACAREYADPADRRFHAQPNACPTCGPRVTLLDADGTPVPSPDPITRAAAALEAGKVVAVKGIGGWHLACAAGSPKAVRALRARKRREEKPLAVMVRDLDEARALAELSPAEEALLLAPERPIVLCRRRADAPLAPEVAPDTALVGLLLPYAPLHHLLLADAGRPLVMTSGNLSDEPIAYDDADALRRLAGVAHRFLVHDRPIASRCDDSVARVVAGRPMVTRRARGHVPRPIRVLPGFARPVLAAGAQLKNACCLGRGEEATLGPHVGDLDGLETFDAFEAAVARLETFLSFRAEALACDLHPQYLSTRWARRRADALGVPLVEVQHHHAHAAAAMAEHGLAGPALAFAWDGTGLGTDGAAWGGELLLVEAGRAQFERLATFRPIPLAGGDQAIREPWRLALAAVRDAFGDLAVLADLPLFDAVPERAVANVAQLLQTGLHCPPAHGAGRAFDAAAALALGRAEARFEGQLAMALEGALDPGAAGAYPFAITSGEPGAPDDVLDLRPLWRALARDVAGRALAGAVSARFHRALVAAGAELVRRARRRTGRLPLVLTGGCFQNAALVEGLREALAGEVEVYQHETVPPGDGGIALGQAVVADAVLRAG
ncbi:MAG TPA: carbamoyltransferase HypF [Anaeromyxobacter sp.]|nr:carbamoyltransferase HypF [Anaeromyxobacter sp.]